MARYSAISRQLENGRTDCAINPSLNQIGWYCRNNVPTGTKAVGRKLPSALGIYDMSGNAWEWCWDWYEEEYPVGPVKDPVGAAAGVRRVRRGGSWGSITQNCRSENREYGEPGEPFYSFGLRLASSAF